ncbi:hypothetical protein EC9_15200 [Rosistilla ulvae]|uniref:Uncharacterized protein n=1 Tax=Rosistilla ulvae TaxID=1930277 RepID=A0A517LXL5_9BACT|nr:hypothetical protein EC9_15200 [Rosistilla ulvae]
MRKAKAILCQVVGGGSTDGGGLNRKNGAGANTEVGSECAPAPGAAFDHAIGSGGVRDALTTGYPLRFLRNGGCAPTRAAPAGIDRRWQPEADAQRCISAAQVPTHETIPQGSQKVAGGRRAAAHLRKTGPIADACSPGSAGFADHTLQIVGLGTRQPHGVIGCSAAIFEQDQIAAGLAADFLKHLHKVGTRDAAGA